MICTVDAVVTAGGMGTRLKGRYAEKPMVKVLGIPMIDRVVDAVSNCDQINEVYVSVSAFTPMTREHLVSRGIKVIDTSGSGYVHDLNKAMTVPKAEKVFVCPADMPLMTAAGVGNVS